MDKKLAVWLWSHGFAPTAKDGLIFLEEIRRNSPKEMLSYFAGSFSARMEMGKEVTEENVVSFLKEKLKTAQRLIAFWEENPKDTNAIFFFKKYKQVEWGESECGST